ncbi:TPA: hypothetical protein RNX65_001406 [Pasteurella multocida]|nr:hypothetical protein [Pasteurella multocida]
MSKFDLARALAGEPVRDPCGNKRYILKHPENGYLVTYSMNNIAVCCSTVWYKTIHHDEFCMCETFDEALKNVTLTLPRPLKTAELNQRVYLITAKGICSQVYKETASDLLMLEDARFFATKEDAQAWDDLAKRVREM